MAYLHSKLAPTRKKNASSVSKSVIEIQILFQNSHELNKLHNHFPFYKFFIKYILQFLKEKKSSESPFAF